LTIIGFSIGLARWKHSARPTDATLRSVLLVVVGGILLLVPIGLLRYTTVWIIHVATPGVQIPLQGIAEDGSATDAYGWRRLGQAFASSIPQEYAIDRRSAGTIGRVPERR